MLRNSEYARRSASKKFKIPSILRKDRLIYCKKQDFTSKQKFDDEIKKINTEEERRVFYVGCSRARKLLFLSYSEYDNSREAAEGTRPSEILSFAQDLREAEGLEIADFSDLEKIERFFAVGSDSGYGRNGKNGSNRSADNAVNDFYGSIIPVSRAFNRIAGRYAEGRKHEIAAIEKIIKKPAPSGKKQQPGRKIFSLSEILSYLNCPSGYLWRYVYNIPEPQSEDAEIGLKVHEQIKTITELCFKSGTPGEEINKITENYLEKLSLKENSSRYIEYIKLFCSSSALSFSDVLRLYTEQLIYWYLDGNAISCKIDRLDVKKDGTLQIMDYKTSSSGAHKNEAAYDGNYMNQLAAYTGACMDVFNKNAGYISSALFYLKDGKTERKAFKDNEISVIKNKISAAIKDINSGRFKIKGPKCGSRCHFYSICDCV
jgi:ATP-dependent helicase/DNAse subunit B